ncbi:MAG: DUF433 domain-containing protein [Saprospiraceae bacterium]|nr:DUF433 domain-containing protein [Saprospiraceae bacterium]
MTEINWQDYISSDPKVLFGKPVVKGTRVPVDLILEKLGKGETIERLLKAYPRVEKPAIYACLMFAAEAVKNEVVVAAA